jgi:hypothetical protein
MRGRTFSVFHFGRMISLVGDKNALEYIEAGKKR